MTTYPLRPLTNVPGVYILTHPGTPLLYVGSSMRLKGRMADWRSALVYQTNPSYNHTMDRMKKLFDPQLWQMKIVREMPGATGAELAAEEARVRDHLIDAGRLLFNAQDTRNEAQVSRLLNDDGDEIDFETAGAALGVSPHSVMNRCQRWRQRGIFEVTLKRLREVKRGRPRLTPPT